MYNSGRGLLGIYYRETGEYKVYSEQKNIDNYKLWYGNYKNSLTTSPMYDSDGTMSHMWTVDWIENTLDGKYNP